MAGDGLVTGAERIAALVALAEEAIVVLDSERRVVASNIGLASGRRMGDVEDALVLYVGGLPAFSAYEELRAGFTAAVSHELRTPLARLLVLLESVTLPGADIPALVEQAREEIEQARNLIDDVLFLGELETGREVVSLGSTLALPVIEEVVAAAADRAAHAEVRIVVTAGPSVELPLRSRMLRVVVENLVANAIRYAGPGATCTVVASSNALIVSDDGVGLPVADLSRIFERFYRADQARSTRGTGLGLAIVKHIVTSAGGVVEARGAPGRGLEVAARF